ncbi:regulator of cell cycle RGCC-like [Phascolarctos cinereus]|uniref:Regulator of cell cycle RGCC-like n=1 Tax=Phascolarctos cinereus TaxID=38626 RepID=A0A6P5JK66_PHACI|nr:regulator of cell cycle RGCC-like [Phascolarctos cinereus]
MASQCVDPRGLGDDELRCLLRELDEVIEDFDNGSSCQYEEHLEELKQKNGLGVYDSGIDEAESTSPSPGSSLNTSEENIHMPATSSIPKAKLGDTKDLEDYIADLDKELEEM